MSSETSRSRTTWWPASVVTVVVLIDQIDTNLVAGALPYLQREWGFGDTAAGAIPTSVAVAALLLALPAGHLADRVVRTRMISTAVAWWSLITTVSALAVSFPVFFATRVVLAGADSIYGPAASSLLADYYEPERRGRVFASYSLAGFVGLGAGVAIGGVLSAALGWRSAFLATVVPGLAVSLLVRRLHEPGRGTSDRVPSSGAAVPAISETMGLLNKAVGVLTGVAAAGKSVASDIVGAAGKVAGTGESPATRPTPPSASAPPEPPPPPTVVAPEPPPPPQAAPKPPPPPRKPAPADPSGSAQ
jgi:MFS family permease